MRAYEIPNLLLEIEDSIHAWASYGHGDLPEEIREKVERLKTEGPPAIDDLYHALQEQETCIELLESEEKRLAQKRAKAKLVHARWRELMLEIVKDCFQGSVKGVYRTYSFRERNGKDELVIR